MKFHDFPGPGPKLHDFPGLEYKLSNSLTFRVFQDRYEPWTSHAGTSSDVAQLQSTVDALAAQMAWFVDKLCGDVADTTSDAENTDTDELPQATGVSGSDGQAEQSAAATDHRHTDGD